MRKSAERIAGMLKSRRAACNLSVQEVVDKLKSQYNIELNAKTIYGYENGVAMPKVDVFIALCAIYGLSSVPSEDGYVSPFTVLRSDADWPADQYNDFFKVSPLEQVYLLIKWGIPDFSKYEDRLNDEGLSPIKRANFNRLYNCFIELPENKFQAAFYSLEQLARSNSAAVSDEDYAILNAYHHAGSVEKAMVDAMVQEYRKKTTEKNAG